MRRGTWISGGLVLGLSFGALEGCTTTVADDDGTATGGTESGTGGVVNSTGGAAATGGSTTTGGDAGEGGAGGEATELGPVQTAVFLVDTFTIQPAGGEPTTLYDFASTVQSWGFDSYLKELDANDPAELSTATWVANDGDPALGAVRLEIPFTDYGQQTGFQLAFPTGELPDWSDSILTVRIKWVSGFNTDPAFPGGLQFAVKTTEAWIYADAPWATVGSQGEWTTYTFDLNNRSFTGPDWDPTQVKAVSLTFNAGTGP